MLDFITKILPVVVTSAVALLAVIAPLTKSDIDNKFLDVLRFIEDKLLSVLFPSLKNPEKNDTI
jgi:hypothetical protein